MKIKTKLNTVFLLVGPTMSGKSTFSYRLLNALKLTMFNAGLGSSVGILSSDDYRNLLMGSNGFDKHSLQMAEVSEQAFALLYANLKAMMAFPVNYDFLIVDTTGMNEVFRNDVRTMAADQGYNVELVVFDYKKEEAIKGVEPQYHEEVLRQVDRLRKDTLANLKSRLYASRTNVTSKAPDLWADLQVEIEDLQDISDSLLYLDKDEGIAVIGDLHESVTALKELLAELDKIDPNLKKVHIGDYLDKGFDTEAMLRLMSDRIIAGDIVLRGNHEAFVVRRLRGEISPAEPEIEAKYLTSVKLFLERPDLQEILFEIYDNHSVPFLKVTGEGCRTLFATHAPCDEVHLGKFSPAALKAQRNLDFMDRSRDYREVYQFIFDQASNRKPLHVFGHVTHKANKHLAYRNKVFLDTGAVYGNFLTAMVYKNNEVKFVQVKSEKRDTTDKVLLTDATSPITKEAAFDIDDYNLDPQELNFVSNFVKSGARFISGTMPPAPATETELESLDAGLDFFRKKGIKHLVLQPKYMGSRCQLYLYKDPAKTSFAVSRNGHVINPESIPGLSELISNWRAKVDNWRNGEWNEIILDGELLPWSALGKELIEKQYKPYGSLAVWELAMLSDTMPKDLEFKNKPDLDSNWFNAGAFHGTLSIYAKETGSESHQVPLEFKGFDILAIDGKTEKWNSTSSSVFSDVNDDPIIVIDLENESDNVRAHEFFNVLTISGRMEGVVLKPWIHTEGIVPYMKVRNSDYLRLIYGYSYQSKLGDFIRNKNISGKVKTSLKEWKLGTAMLEETDTEKLVELAVKMIAQLKIEKTLDPRL